VAKQKTFNPNTNTFINRLGYSMFLLLGIYQVLWGNHCGQGIANLGIAMIFDPFNPQQPWQQRPLYQRIWLLLHVGIVICGFIYLISTK
jgi:hypothetical protein